MCRREASHPCGTPILQPPQEIAAYMQVNVSQELLRHESQGLTPVATVNDGHLWRSIREVDLPMDFPHLLYLLIDICAATQTIYI